jgi:hypothetical protein
MQMDDHRNFFAISFKSLQLKDHKKGYTPLLLELPQLSGHECIH